MWPGVDDHERGSCTGIHCAHPLHASNNTELRKVAAVAAVEEVAVADDIAAALAAADETAAVAGTAA
eukprot:15203129-Ditylum_brightwellii.AAC.1